MHINKTPLILYIVVRMILAQNENGAREEWERKRNVGEVNYILRT